MAKVEITLARWRGSRAAADDEEATGLLLRHCRIDGIQVPVGRVRLHGDGFLSVTVRDVLGLGLPDYPLSGIESVEQFVHGGAAARDGARGDARVMGGPLGEGPGQYFPREPVLHGFDPDWVIAPGETLAAWFAEQGFTDPLVRHTVADRYGIRPGPLAEFMAGAPLTEDLATRIAAMTRISRSFWLALEHNFRVGLAAGKTWVGA